METITLPEDSKKEDIQTLSPLKANEIPKNIEIIEEKEINSQSAPNDTDSISYIRNKRAYNRFLAILRKGKYTSAMMTAQALGVNNRTILSWLKTKKAIECMSEEVAHYVDTISSSKDWKAQAYLLDKVLAKDTEDSKADLTHLIQINIGK